MIRNTSSQGKRNIARKKNVALKSRSKLAFDLKAQPLKANNFLALNSSVATLYRIPTLDNNDSLIFVPSRMNDNLNWGNFPNVLSMLTSRFAPGCEIDFTLYHMKAQLSPPAFVQLLKKLFELHPDYTLGTRSTKVEENVIDSFTHLRFTDSKVIYDSIVGKGGGGDNESDEHFKAVYSGRRGDAFKEKLALDSRPEKERQDLSAVVYSNVDLVVNVSIRISITFDHSKSKITAFRFEGQMQTLNAL